MRASLSAESGAGRTIDSCILFGQTLRQSVIIFFRGESVKENKRKAEEDYSSDNPAAHLASCSGKRNFLFPLIEIEREQESAKDQHMDNGAEQADRSQDDFSDDKVNDKRKAENIPEEKVNNVCSFVQLYLPTTQDQPEEPQCTQ